MLQYQEFSVHQRSAFSQQISYTSVYLHDLYCLAPFNQLFVISGKSHCCRTDLQFYIIPELHYRYQRNLFISSVIFT